MLAIQAAYPQAVRVALRTTRPKAEGLLGGSWLLTSGVISTPNTVAIRVPSRGKKTPPLKHSRRQSAQTKVPRAATPNLRRVCCVDSLFFFRPLCLGWDKLTSPIPKGKKG